MARDRSNEWIGATFVGIGLGAAGVAGALAWVTSRIGPAAIPIWAIVGWASTMVFRGPLGKALASRLAGEVPDGMSEVPPELYAELDDLRLRLGEVEERVDFSERLLTQQQETAQRAMPEMQIQSRSPDDNS